MIVRHENGRIHVGVLFQEASNKCTDECGTGTVCFEHMTERLREVADYVKQLELQLSEMEKKWGEEYSHHMSLLADLKTANRLNGELKALLREAHDALDLEWDKCPDLDKRVFAVLEPEAAKSLRPVGETPKVCPVCKKESYGITRAMFRKDVEFACHKCDVDEKRNCEHGNAPGWCHAVGCPNESKDRKFR